MRANSRHRKRLEQLQADVNTSFNERSLVTDLVPNRDVGLQLWGDINGGVLSYAAGIFNGVGDARNSSNAAFENEIEFAGRLFAQPFKNSDLTAACKAYGFGVTPALRKVAPPAQTDLPATTGAHFAWLYPDRRAAAIFCLQLLRPARWFRAANIGGFHRRDITTTRAVEFVG